MPIIYLATPKKEKQTFFVVFVKRIIKIMLSDLPQCGQKFTQE
jgi:hypothetical protein